MFKTATFFRIAEDFVLPPVEALEEALQKAQFLPCGATQPESSGWVPPRGNKSTVLVEAVGRQAIMRLCTERRPLPASAVKAAVEERIERYKQETGYERVSSKVKKEIKEEAILDLLPRAFTKKSATTLWIDPVNKILAVDSGSLAGADKVVSALVEALSEIQSSGPGIMARPVQTAMSAATAMAHWLSSRDAPVGFTVDRDCELKMPDDQKSTVRYSRHTLEIDEVAQHIASGKVPTQLAMTWNDRVSFVLTDMSQVKKIKLLDVVLDGVQDKGKDDDGFDTDAAIVTGELSALIPDLLEALGGEMVGGESTPQTEAPPGSSMDTGKKPFIES
ncbi:MULTISPECIES: recombination-associated protein RdgC [Polaromonas]|uniref:Recombination-associated protein RdgC n=1 Tax=Polaromonas aquatica TaxID=332657 RepID=A0ABW1TVE7_9BURK